MQIEDAAKRREIMEQLEMAVIVQLELWDTIGYIETLLGVEVRNMGEEIAELASMGTGRLSSEEFDAFLDSLEVEE